VLRPGQTVERFKLDDAGAYERVLSGVGVLGAAGGGHGPCVLTPRTTTTWLGTELNPNSRGTKPGHELHEAVEASKADRYSGCGTLEEREGDMAEAQCRRSHRRASDGALRARRARSA